MAESREGHRPIALPPSHITEFASDEYFSKLQQQQQQQQQQQTEVKDASSTTPLQPSQFILPLRNLKASEPAEPQPTEVKREKKSLLSLRPRFQSKHSRAQDVATTISQPRSSTESTSKRYAHTMSLSLAVISR